MNRLFTLRAAVCALALAAVLSLAAPDARAQNAFNAANNTATQYAAFDAMTNVTTAQAVIGASPNTGNTFMGDSLILDTSANGNQVQKIVAFDAAVVNNSGAALNLTGLRLNVQFWGNTGTATGADAFASALGTPIVFNFTGITAAAPFALANNTYQPIYNSPYAVML